MTPSSDYETICHSLGRTKSLLENINSEISDKLSLWEHKSRLLNNSVTKRYEPLVLEYLDGYIDDMCEFYLNNSDDICRIFQQAITQKQHQVDTSRADLLKRKQHIQQMQEQKEQEINTQRAKTLETLQRQRDSLENNLKLVETEVNSMQSELSNITASLNEAPQNDDDFEYLTNFRNSLVEQVDAKQRELQEWKEQSRLRQMQLSEYSSALKPQRCETNWEAERELVSKTNVRLREQIEKMHNVISKRFPSEEDDLRSLALAELQNEKALASLQHSILENAANQQFSECKKLLHALGILIRNCSSNTRIATAIIKILDIFFQNNETVERQSFAVDQLKSDLDIEEVKEALPEMVRLGILHEHEAGQFTLASN